ncbi:MAG TPA: hypothetical protein VFE47_19370 [Tepidisphaeraceae bacterium]|nr:hypothetical protein [Tepidisphaeraceae bacterium]
MLTTQSALVNGASDGYAFRELMETDRCQRQPGFLLYDPASAEDYLAMAQEWGLGNRREDFVDPNQGFGSQQGPFRPGKFEESAAPAGVNWIFGGMDSNVQPRKSRLSRSCVSAPKVTAVVGSRR